MFVLPVTMPDADAAAVTVEIDLVTGKGRMFVMFADATSDAIRQSAAVDLGSW